MPLTFASRSRVVAITAAAATAISLTPATAAEAQTYYSTKQPYSPAAPISSYSQPPAGFHQIYTSSVDRHGSRGLSGFKYDDLAQQMLEAAAKRDQLTDLGKRLIPQVEAMIQVNEELVGPGKTGYGNLTTFGREELRGIGVRNAARNAEFLDRVAASGNDKVKFMSSGADRAIESGQEFGNGLLSVNPSLVGTLADGASNGTVNLETRKDLLHAHTNKEADSYEAYSAWKDGDVLKAKVEQAYAKPASQEAAEGLLSKIFAPEFIDDLASGRLAFTGRKNESKTVNGVVDAALQFYNLYIIAPALEREASKPKEGWIFHEYMDDADGPTFAYLLDVEDYYEKGPAIEGQTVAYDNYAPLLNHMIQGVKDRAAGGDIAAEYRFGHAETIIPLAALLKLPGSEKAVPADEVMTYDNSAWRGDKVAPMGANIQWDAFQNDEGITLVRMLYNEAEIPFHDGCMPVADNSHFYTIDELADCLPLGSTSDHSKARPNIAPAVSTGGWGSSLSSAGSSTGGTAALVLAVLAALSAALGLGAVQAGLIQLPALPALPPLPL